MIYAFPYSLSVPVITFYASTKQRTSSFHFPLPQPYCKSRLRRTNWQHHFWVRRVVL